MEQLETKEEEKDGKLLHNSTSVLAVIAFGFLAFNMLGILIYKQQVFLEREGLSSVEIFIGIGFGLVLLFNVVSLLWVITRMRKSGRSSTGYGAILLLGAFCLALLVGEKVLVDEIGREYQLGWEVLGEWIILYTFLTIQLIYNIVILFKLFLVHRHLSISSP